jgi:hypothetical protein
VAFGLWLGCAGRLDARTSWSGGAPQPPAWRTPSSMPNATDPALAETYDVPNN